MARYNGRYWTRAELLARVGHMRQLAGITPFEYVDGHARGTRGYQVYTGGGFTFDVLADRALDIGGVQFNGLALAWSSANGPVHPAYYESDGLGWLRSLAGGLVTTCGLDQFGSPAEDGGESFGIHGRVGNLPAAHVGHRMWWENDEYYLEISGQVRQARLFGENLLLTRRITTQLGANTITITDTVTNDGFQPQPHMLLYHCNVGFPLLSADATLHINTTETIPRDEAAAAGLDTWHRFDAPTPDYAEQVFRHAVTPDEDGNAVVKLRNPASGLALTLTYSHTTLPHLFQWKQAGQGAYVLGIEPANSSAIEGRAVARSRDDLPHLQPRESRTYSLRFTVSDDSAEQT
jgi:hypothetical protein